MTDRLDDFTERNDPVLVRPYVNVGSDEEQPPGDETWPGEETAERPAVEQPTAIQPAIVLPPVPEPKSPAMHWPLRLLVLVIGVAVALAIVAYFVLGGGSRDDARRGPSASLPVVNAPAPTGGVAPSASAKPSSSTSPSRSASSSPSASGSISAPPSGAQKPSTPASLAPTLAAPPAGNRTGRISSSATGRCLALGGLLGIDGSPIQTASCSGGSSQKFTLATDGTLQVASRCATAGGDGSVRSGGCGSGTGGQWRAGPDGSLVNPSSGLCLTDPGRAGATTTVAACTGGDPQRWSLP